MCFPHGCILTLPILDTGGPLGVRVDLSVFFGVVVAAGVVADVTLPSVVFKHISNYLFVCFVCPCIIYVHKQMHCMCFSTYVCIYVCLSTCALRVLCTYTIDYIMHSNVMLCLLLDVHLWEKYIGIADDFNYRSLSGANVHMD